MTPTERPPELSIVVVFHDMRREAPRTLLSLSGQYQTGVDPDAYEIIAIDNGSAQPLDAPAVEAIGTNIRYVRHETDSVSPVGALNLGADVATGRYLAFIVDGARMASPGLVDRTLGAIRTSHSPFLCSLSWHLGPDVQNRSMLHGYDQRMEDLLLNDIAWPTDGYRLFEISTLAQSSEPGFFGGFPAECSWLCLSRAGFERLGGYDPGFRSPGGGLVNQDVVNRGRSKRWFRLHRPAGRRGVPSVPRWGRHQRATGRPSVRRLPGRVPAAPRPGLSPTVDRDRYLPRSDADQRAAVRRHRDRP